MTLAEIEDALPNGFHDALLQCVNLDYSTRRAAVALRVCVGDPDGATEEEREAYKSAEIHLLDLVYFVIKPPDPGCDYRARVALWVEAGAADAESAPPPPMPLDLLPAGAFAYWFFVRDWNSFIHVAAIDASLRWPDEHVEPAVR